MADVTADSVESFKDCAQECEYDSKCNCIQLKDGKCKKFKNCKSMHRSPVPSLSALCVGRLWAECGGQAILEILVHKTQKDTYNVSADLLHSLVLAFKSSQVQLQSCFCSLNLSNSSAIGSFLHLYISSGMLLGLRASRVDLGF